MLPVEVRPCTSAAVGIECVNTTVLRSAPAAPAAPSTSTVMSAVEQHVITEQMIMIWICIVGYVVSTLLCIGSLYIFRHFRKLWCLRNLVHANFIGCIATHNLCWLLLAAMLSLGVHSCWLTALFVEVAKFCVTSTFCWMLVEGAYLYLSILHCLHAHRIKYWQCATIGWGLPFALSMRGLYARFVADQAAAASAFHEHELPPQVEAEMEAAGGCLNVNEALDSLTVFVICFIIFTNIAILLAVIYVLFTKFRQVSDKEWAGLRHIFRALLFLCPLLGINYAFTIYHPENPEWLSTAVAFYSLFINASQGTFISIFFCFNHEEVRACLRRSFVVTRSALTIKVHEMRRKSMEESQLTFLGP